MPNPRPEFLGLSFDAVSIQSALAEVMRLAHGERFTLVVTPNVDHIVRLHRLQEAGANIETENLFAAYNAARLCLCDSRVLAGLARLSGIALPVVTGSDLTAALLTGPLDGIATVALVGGTQSQFDWLSQRHPTISWSQHIPPMGLRHNAAAQRNAVRFIVETRADIVLLAIGSPQSELVGQQALVSSGARGVGLCIGASVEFITGEKRRAPPVIGKLGLEWAFRLLTEPRRLWRRYLVDGPMIFPIWIGWRRNL